MPVKDHRTGKNIYEAIKRQLSIFTTPKISGNICTVLDQCCKKEKENA